MKIIIVKTKRELKKNKEKGETKKPCNSCTRKRMKIYFNVVAPCKIIEFSYHTSHMEIVPELTF